MRQTSLATSVSPTRLDLKSTLVRFAGATAALLVSLTSGGSFQAFDQKQDARTVPSLAGTNGRDDGIKRLGGIAGYSNLEGHRSPHASPRLYDFQSRLGIFGSGSVAWSSHINDRGPMARSVRTARQDLRVAPKVESPFAADGGIGPYVHPAPEIEIVTTDPAPVGGWGLFYAHDEILTACDLWPDGWYAWTGLLTADYSLDVGVIDRNGSAEGCGVANLRIPEGMPVKIKVCLLRGDAVDFCSTWEYGSA
ncbi:MAG: hypothetical protein ACRD2X_00820 [Vicinamibacteraceae bacterium]